MREAAVNSCKTPRASIRNPRSPIRNPLSTHHQPRSAPKSTPDKPLYGAARKDRKLTPHVVRRDDLAPGHTRFACTVAYDGTDYVGWQSQPDGKAVQDVIEARLARVFRKPIRIHGSGRTDSGVHADRQVFHFDAEWRHPKEILLKALHADMPADILIKDIRVAKPNFHARFSARGKRYVYRIRLGFSPPDRARFEWALGSRPVNVEAMKEAAGRLVGVHDFTAFGGMHKQGMERENPVKDLRRLDVARKGDLVVVTTEAGGYLYKMVRRLVGGLVQVGLGRMTPDRLIAYRDELRISAEVPTAPARGLTKSKVFFSLPKNANTDAFDDAGE